MWSALWSLLCSSQQRGFLVWGFDPSTLTENVQKCRLDGEEVLILHLRTAESHELRQAEQVFDIVARVAAADGNLGSNLFVRGRTKVDGVVRSSDVDEGQQRTLAFLPRDELHRLCYVTPQHNLSHVQVLKGFFNLGGSDFIDHSPCARLPGKQVAGRYSS